MTKKATRFHEHFCTRCSTVYGGVGGWWRCADKKCTRLSIALCQMHVPTKPWTAKEK